MSEIVKRRAVAIRRLLALSCAGAIFIVSTFRSSAITSDHDFTVIHEVHGESAGDIFGLGDGIGDVDGDGIPDFVVGAPAGNDGSPRTGAAYVYSGRTGGVLHVLFGQQTDWRFAAFSRGTGDLNGDGVPDFMVGAPHADIRTEHSGALYVYSGATFAPLYPPLVGLQGSHLGETLEVLEDMNGDGVPELAGSGALVNAVDIFSGRTGALLQEVTIPGTGRLGVALASLDDVDGDTVPDFAASGGESGPVFIVSGTGGIIRTLSMPASGLEAIGDVDGDGHRDLLVGSLGLGRVVVLSSSSWTALRTHFAPGGAAGFGDFEETLGALGDIDGDGVRDYAIGAWSSGKVFIFSGATGDQVAVLSDERPGSLFGFPTDIGDLDHDGVDELLIGAPGDDVGGRVDTGTAWVVSLTSIPLPVANAGDDQIVECESTDGATVTLDGSESLDPRGEGLSYIWTGPFTEGGGTVTGANPTVTLPVGPSFISLVVNDGRTNSAPDAVSVTVTVEVSGLGEPCAALVPDGNTPPLPTVAFKLGRTLPLKLKLRCGITELTDAEVTAPCIVALIRAGNAIDLQTIDPDSGQANDNGVFFRYSAPNWVYNLSTKGLMSGTYVIVIRTPDGQRYVGAFVLK